MTSARYGEVVRRLKAMSLDQARQCAAPLAKGLTISERFLLIHEIGFYATPVSVSGPCSELVATQSIRAALPRLLGDLGVESLLDAPCGDCTWMSHVDLSGIDYIGIDIVAPVIESNRKRFDRRFEVGDISADALPRADLILCRDALVHLSNETVLATLSNFRRSQARWLLTTTFRRPSNIDIECGEFRPIDLRIAPFNLGEPLTEIDECCTIDGGQFLDKRLALWPL